MTDENIVVLGANGQLGRALKNRYPNAVFLDKEQLNITNGSEIAAYDWSKVTVLINAAAYTKVDAAETDEGRKLAWQVNAHAPGLLCDIAIKNNLTLVHVSTDYVFDGLSNVHDEDERFSPLSVYGASKAAGDIAISLAPQHYILRTSWVIGEGANFVMTMRGLALKNISPSVVDDQIGRLTFTSELVRAIDFLLSRKAPFGTYNLSNSGDAVSWAKIAREVFTLIGKTELSVTAVSTAEYYNGKSGIATRPLQSNLSLEKIHALGFESNDWRNDLQNYIRSII